MRVGKNIGWLAASTGFSAVASLIYVALTARALGPAGFGIFALVMTCGELVSNLAQFQSWKAVVSFGAPRYLAGDRKRLARLLGYAVTLDQGAAILGVALAVVCSPVAGQLLHWSPSQDRAAALFATALLLTSSNAPAGALRLFNRFDLLALSEVGAQVTRLIGCTLGWAFGGTVDWFLVTWGLAALLLLVGQWVAVLSLGHRFSFGPRAFRIADRENRGLWPFMLKTNISSTLSVFWTQVGTLVVGAVAGPVQAGGFRLAHRFSQGMMKPVEMATRALFPELARLVAEGEHATITRVLVRVTWLAATLACGVVMIAAVGGRLILRLMAGTPFEFAREFLFLLAIAAAINVAGFALEPFLNAHRRAGMVLRAYGVAAIAYGLLLALLLPAFRADGVAFAAIGGSVILIAQLAAAVIGMLRDR